MKFFVAALFCLLLLGDSEGSTLCRAGPIRAVNTTLKTNFNGTYQRKDPCTNGEVETSSYLASHELHHHTKDNWSDYTHKCSTIIVNFLQTIGNLIRFNHKQNGSFNFYLNTSISQKQDVSGKQESCDSLPTIVIEATDCEIPLDPPGKASPPPSEAIDPYEDLPTPTPSCGSPNGPATLPPPASTTPPGGGCLPREAAVPPGMEFSTAFLPPTPTGSPAVSDDLPRDIQPFEPKPKYFKTSLRLTPQADPENGTVKPRIQYMAANLLPPTAEPQNPLPQPETLQLSPDRPIEPTPPLPEYIPPQPPTLQPYPAAPDTPQTPTPDRFSFPPPQPAPLLSNQPPSPFPPPPPTEFPTASPPSQPATTASYQQEISTSEFGPSTPQPFDVTPNPNFGQRMPPEVQSPLENSLANQDAPLQPPSADQAVSPPLEVQPPTGPQQYQPQPPFYNPLPYNMPPPANDAAFLTTPPPPPPPQPVPSPDYADPAPAESPRDVLTNPEQPSAPIAAPPAPPSAPQPPTYPLATANPQFTPVSAPPQHPLADMPSTTQLPSSITTVQQETTTFEQAQSTPAMPSYPGPTRDPMPGQIPENLPNRYDPRSAPQFPADMAPQQYPPTGFSGFPQAQPPAPAPFPDSNGDSPLRQPMTSQETSEIATEQNSIPNQGQAVPEMTAPMPPQQEPLPFPITTPMPYPADTELPSSSPVTAVEYGNSAAPFAQQRLPTEAPSFPTPPPQPLPTPQGLIPEQPITPDYPLNAMPNSFGTTAPPQPFPDNARPFQPFPQRPFAPPPAETRDPAAVTPIQSAQEPPVGGDLPPQQPMPPVPRPLRLSGVAPISSESLTSSTDEQFATPPPEPLRFQEPFPPAAQPPQLPPPTGGPNTVTTVSQTTITDSAQYTQAPTAPPLPFQSPLPEGRDASLASPDQPPEVPQQPLQFQATPTPSPDYEEPVAPLGPPPAQLPNQPFGFSTPPPAFQQDPTAFPNNQPSQPPFEPPVTAAPNAFALSQTTTETEQYSQPPNTPVLPPQWPNQGPTAYPQAPRPNRFPERPHNAFPQPQPQTTAPYTEYPQPPAPQPPYFLPTTTPSPQLSDYQVFDITTTVPPMPQVPDETGNGRDSVEEVRTSLIPPQQPFADPSPGIQQVPDFLPDPSVTPPTPPTSQPLINAPQMPLENNLPIPPQNRPQPPMDPQLRHVGQPAITQPGNAALPFDPQLPFNSLPAPSPQEPNRATANAPTEPQQFPNEAAIAPTAFNPQQPLAETFNAQTPMNPSPPQTTPSYLTTTIEETTQTVLDSDRLSTPDAQQTSPPMTPPERANDLSTSAPPAPPQPQTQTTAGYNQNLPQNPDRSFGYPPQAPLLSLNAQPNYRPQGPWAPPQTALPFGAPFKNGRFDSVPEGRPSLAYDRPGQPAALPSPYASPPSNDMRGPQFPAGQPVPAILDAQPSPPSNASKSTVIIEEITTTESPQLPGPQPDVRPQRPPADLYRPTLGGPGGEPVGYFGPRYPPNPYDPRFPINPNFDPNYHRRFGNLDSVQGPAPNGPLPINGTEVIASGPGPETLAAPTGPQFSDPQPMPQRPSFAPTAEPPPRPPTQTPNPPPEMPANPLFHAMESHLALPAPGRPYLRPGRFDPNHRSPVDGAPAPPPPGYFVNPRVDSPRDIPNRPQVDPQVLLPAQTAPSNGPGTSISPSAVLLPLLLHRLLE